MSIKSFIKEHLLGHHISDDVASFVGGGVFANVFTTQFVNHTLEVAVVGFVGGACGLIGKLAIQFIYDKFFKSKINNDDNRTV